MTLIQLIAYEFLFVFHCNYGHLLYCCRNKARYWSNNATLYSRFHLTRSPRTLWHFPKVLIQIVQVPKLLDGGKYCRKVNSTPRVERNNVTDDRQTT